MQHLFEVLKIVDGAVNADRKKVAAYAEQLAVKLEAEGDARSASGIRRAIANAKAPDLSAARMVPASLPVDSESRLKLADERVFAPDEVKVYLDEQTTERVAEFVHQVNASDVLLASGVGIAPSLLMHGPPGCGKTELAKHIAAHLNLPLLTARSDSLISSYLGSTSKNLRNLFEHATSRPCVLFLDEFDALAKLRDDQRELGELKRVVVSLLQNIDALDNKTVLLAATNHEHLLDPAVWRRFAFRLQIGLPSAKVRAQMITDFLGAQAPDLDVHLLAAATEGMSGADLRHLCEDARRSAILRENVHAAPIHSTDLLNRLVRAKIATFETLNLRERLVAVRALSSKLFTVRRLADVFEISTGRVSMLLREGDAE